jgi:glycosyltransferase involved in cell wall biosynthesis
MRREFGARGRARAEAEFAWPVIAARHLDFFQRVIAR